MIEFAMTDIKVEQFAIVQPDFPGLEDISLMTELSYKYSVESKEVACLLGFTFKKDEKPLLIINCTCIFSINPKDWESMVTENGIVLPKELMEFLAVQTIGVTRGILFCKTEGSDYQKLIVPPINVRAMLEN